ncbi:MAG: pyridoxal 5'-phosphate synthase glutaminase subunit PdxT [Acidimicrobiales bacterium]
MRVGVLALQGDVAEHLAALADLGVEAKPVRRPDEIHGIDGLILPGGESTTISMLLSSSGLCDPVEKLVEQGTPVFGTCAGMILLASSLGDGRRDQMIFGAIDIGVRRNGFGRQLDSFECELDVAGVEGGPVHAVFIRAPLVESVGDGVEVLAEVEQVDPMSGAPVKRAVLCRQGQVLVSAFHPELTDDRRLHRMFVTMIEQRGG